MQRATDYEPKTSGFKNDAGFAHRGVQKLQDLERRINSSFQPRTYFKPDFVAFGRKQTWWRCSFEQKKKNVNIFLDIFFFLIQILFQRFLRVNYAG